jgi:hypothetical protein
VTVHLACHARAQNMGPKAAEMLRLIIPDTPIDVIERCSGHGGTFGVVKPTRESRESRPHHIPHGGEPGARPYRLGLSAGGAAHRAQCARVERERTASRRPRAKPNIRSRSSRAHFGLME